MKVTKNYLRPHFGMDGAGLGVVRHDRLVPIHGLQQQEVGDLRGASTTRRGDTPAERLASLMQQSE